MKKTLLFLFSVLCAVAQAGTIPSYPGATTPLAGTEKTVIDQSGATKSVTTSQIAQAPLGSVTAAAASTIDLGALGGHIVTITGTAGITSFGSTAPAGTIFYLYFTGSPTLTFDSVAMNFPSQSDLTVTPGEFLVMESLGGGSWTSIGPSLFSMPNDAEPTIGNSLGDAIVTIYGYLSTIGAGPCISAPLSSSIYTISVSCPSAQVNLSKSGSNLALCPYNGNQIMIGGVLYTIPNSCITLAPTGLTPSTFYYIYVYSNSGAPTLMASGTGHSTDSSTGVEEMTGDATKTLVGGAYVITGPAFSDNATLRGVYSWYNQGQKRCLNTFTTNRTYASTSVYGEPNSEIRCSFVWMFQPASSAALARAFSWSFSGSAANGTSSDGCATSVGIDSTSSAQTENVQTFGTTQAGVSASGINLSLNTEGLHYITILGLALTGGTCTWYSAPGSPGYSFSLEADVWE